MSLDNFLLNASFSADKTSGLVSCMEKLRTSFHRHLDILYQQGYPSTLDILRTQGRCLLYLYHHHASTAGFCAQKYVLEILECRAWTQDSACYMMQQVHLQGWITPFYNHINGVYQKNIVQIPSYFQTAGLSVEI